MPLIVAKVKVWYVYIACASSALILLSVIMVCHEVHPACNFTA